MALPTTPATTNATATAHPTANPSDGLHPLASVFLVVVFFILVLKGGGCGKNNPPQHSESKQEENNTAQSDQKRTKNIYVKYGKEYGETTYLPYGYLVSFVGSTTGYCATNGSTEKCANKGQDLDLGDLNENASLRFKTSGGEESGNLTLELTQK